ncbi:hypothetical protein LX36DRAFT_668419 [Colletotrichum falcatum]|nr:hypothetical protein LX36DRAFT_668419 [Colletotrichum falcatum]
MWSPYDPVSPEDQALGELLLKANAELDASIAAAVAAAAAETAHPPSLEEEAQTGAVDADGRDGIDAKTPEPVTGDNARRADTPPVLLPPQMPEAPITPPSEPSSRPSPQLSSRDSSRPSPQPSSQPSPQGSRQSRAPIRPADQALLSRLLNPNPGAPSGSGSNCPSIPHQRQGNVALHSPQSQGHAGRRSRCAGVPPRPQPTPAPAASQPPPPPPQGGWRSADGTAPKRVCRRPGPNFGAQALQLHAQHYVPVQQGLPAAAFGAMNGGGAPRKPLNGTWTNWDTRFRRAEEQRSIDASLNRAADGMANGMANVTAGFGGMDNWMADLDGMVGFDGMASFDGMAGLNGMADLNGLANWNVAANGMAGFNGMANLNGTGHYNNSTLQQAPAPAGSQLGPRAQLQQFGHGIPQSFGNGLAQAQPRPRPPMPSFDPAAAAASQSQPQPAPPQPQPQPPFMPPADDRIFWQHQGMKRKRR